MKRNNNLLILLVAAYVLVTALQHVYLYIQIDHLMSTEDITAKASGEVKLCINLPPALNYTCPLVVYEDEEYYCLVNATDPDGGPLTFDSAFVTEPELFNITPEGIINFTPVNEDVGNITFLLTVVDDTVCANNLDYRYYTMQIINVNDPPYLVQPIPNQTWNQDISMTAFDLDNYFADPDGDPINYTYTLLNNIAVQIDANNIVSFTPIAGWHGVEHITFFAWDPYMANGSSNPVKLEVIQTSTPEEEEPPSGGGGGGGGGGYIPTCIPQWYCRPWGKCQPDNLQYRECYDLNNCTNPVGEPNLTQACEFISTCYDGIKGPNEEQVDCGGVCPPCGSCYDEVCNNGEDCTKNLTDIPDCGGPCQECTYESETCYDNVCNNNEDCTRGLTDIPDCGGPCDTCPDLQEPSAATAFNWALLFFIGILLAILTYSAHKLYPQIKHAVGKRRKRLYEERLLLEAKISESIFDSLSKLEGILDKETMGKLIVLYSTIVRRYFKSLFDLSYEFTYDELNREIESKNISETFKDVLTNFFNRSLEMEFSERATSKQELKAMISEFKQIISFTSEKPFLEADKKSKSQKDMDKVDRMFNKIAEAESLLRRKDINSAYFIYRRLLGDFKTLSPEDKQKLHGFISRLYDEIALARERWED